MLKDTVDGEFTTLEDVAEAAFSFAGFKTNALTGQSLIVSRLVDAVGKRPFIAIVLGQTRKGDQFKRYPQNLTPLDQMRRG